MTALSSLAHELATQDNLCTSFPLFLVQQEHRIYGMDTDYCENKIYSWNDDPEYFWNTREEALSEVIKSGRTEDNFADVINEVGYVTIWVFVTAHLTRKAAQLYIEQNAHNLKSPRIYVSSQYRCHEFNAAVEFLKECGK